MWHQGLVAGVRSRTRYGWWGYGEKQAANAFARIDDTRQHMRLLDPLLTTRVSTCGHLIPDGPKANSYMAMLTDMQDLEDWKVGHRYWDEAAIPLSSLPAWERLAAEANAMMDQARLDGVL